MSFHRLRLTLIGVTFGWAISIGAYAGASGTVVVKPGDSLDSLARRFHVSKKDIAVANGIAVEALLRNGATLRIPDPPKHVVSAATMDRQAVVAGDRVSVRLGPYQAYRREMLLDHGTSVVVTHRAGNWLQVAMPGGDNGWVREEYIAYSRAEADRRNDARHVAERPHVARARVARRNTDEEDSRPARSRRRHHRTEVASSKHSRRAPHHRYAQVRRRSQHEMASHRARRHSTREAAIRGRRWREQASVPPGVSGVIRTAYACRGVPYRWAGESPRGFDCSGFTSYIYRKKGVSLPHSASEQFHVGKHVSESHLKPGDLVFFHTTRAGISHVGIYAGHGRFVHASSGGGRVRIDSLSESYYKSRFRGARRVK